MKGQGEQVIFAIWTGCIYDLFLTTLRFFYSAHHHLRSVNFLTGTVTLMCKQTFNTALVQLSGNTMDVTSSWYCVFCRVVTCGSLGVIIYIMICGYPPFYSETPSKALSKNMKKKIIAGTEGYWCRKLFKILTGRFCTTEPLLRWTRERTLCCRKKKVIKLT